MIKNRQFKCKLSVSLKDINAIILFFFAYKSNKWVSHRSKSMWFARSYSNIVVCFVLSSVRFFRSLLLLSFIFFNLLGICTQYTHTYKISLLLDWSRILRGIQSLVYELCKHIHTCTLYYKNDQISSFIFFLLLFLPV